MHTAIRIQIHMYTYTGTLMNPPKYTLKGTLNTHSFFPVFLAQFHWNSPKRNNTSFCRGEERRELAGSPSTVLKFGLPTALQ